MENQTYSNELQHHGTKGMRWGIRRYQNKDGSLTPAGQKRYNKEVEKLKKETAKVRAEEKAAANRKKTQAKFDKLEAKKQALEERKKALKGETDDKKTKEETPEALEARREKLLKSTNAKELYENKDALSSQELNDRINRIDLEARLQSKIIEEPKKTGLDYVNQAKQVIDTATGLYRSVDNAYSTVANSAIGKTLAKQLGIELGKDDKFNIDKLRNKANKTLQDMKTLDEYSRAEKNYLTNTKQIKDLIEKQKQAEANKAEGKKSKKDKNSKTDNDNGESKSDAQKKVDEYNERWRKGDSDDKVSSGDSTYRKSGSDLSGSRDTTKNFGLEDKRQKSEPDVEYAKSDGKVYGEGTSRSKYASDNSYSKSESDRPLINSTYEEIKTSSSSTSPGRSYVSGLLENKSSSVNNNSPKETVSIGQSYIAGYLEDKR